MKGSEALQKAMKDLDLNPVFGNPGTTELPMLRNIGEYRLTLHDSISVGMADGRSQYLGRPSVVNLHDLPGVANSMAFIYTAKANRSPLVITAGQQDSRHAVYDPLLYGNLTELVGSAVKYRYEVRTVSDIGVSLKRARDIAMTPPFGPVFVSFPMDIMDQEAEYSPVRPSPGNHDLVDDDAVREISERINQARNPAIVFGYEIDVFDAYREAEEFASKLGCPVYGEPLSSRSVFNTSDRHYAGDLLPGTTLINLKLLEHDLILFIGGDILFYPYLPSPPLPGKEVIFVGLDNSNKIGDSYVMNPKMFLKSALNLVQKKGDFSRKPDLTFPNKVARDRKQMGLNYVLSRVRKEFRDYTIVDESVSASTTLRSIMGYSSRSYFTARTGQLGWGSAASLGIAMENPRTLAVIGDGSFMYTIQSLWTAGRYNLPVKYLVLNNGGYNILKSYSISYYPEMAGADYLNLGLRIEEIAAGFGVETKVAGPDLDELSWLKEGETPKVLVVNVNPAVQKMFL